MRKSSTSGRGLAHELLNVQQVNGFHSDVESKSSMRSNGSGLDHGAKTTQLTLPDAFSPIVYASRAMGEIIDKIRRARGSSAPVLITGETGTGKELIARAVHAVSPRHGREFIPFNCGDVTTDLIASELFGHQRGAFTSADRDSKGVIRAADEGTILLDEIGELPLTAQSKLLRFLQEGEIRPVGDSRPIKVNVRVVAATNRDLEADVRSGRFRDDLYYRLNVFRLHIPPLRERREDIRPLLEHFLTLRQQETGKLWSRLSDEALALLLGYHWPGNVREVENLSHRLMASAVNGEMMKREIILDAIRAGIRTQSPATVVIDDNAVIALDLPLHEALEKLERLLIEHALEKTGGNLLRTAARLKICRNGLKNKIRQFGIKNLGK